MNNDSSVQLICAKLLVTYGLCDHPSPEDVIDLRIHRARLYAFTHIFSFEFHGRHYYISDDYSLSDTPDLVRNLLEESFARLDGKLLKNPTPQSDGALYAAGLDGTEYYLWQCADKNS